MASRDSPTKSNSPRLERREVSGTTPAGVPNMVDQMKQYIDQVIIICSTMLTFLQQQQQQTVDVSSETISGDKRDEQVEFLKTKLKELVDVNVSWQHTHQQQERRIAELQHQLGQMTTSPADKQQTPTESLIEELKVKNQQLELEKCILESQNQQLKGEVDDLTERCQLLDMQLVVNKEDFESERKDRERGQQRANELLMELERCKQLLNTTFRPADQPRQPPYDPWRNQRPLGNYAVDVFDGADEQDAAQFAVVDYVKSGDTVTDGVTVTDGEELLCPNCRQTFTKDQHEQLMDHMDKCEYQRRTF